MTDGQWLFAVFAALYLLECMRWLPGTVYVLTCAGKAWDLRRPWKAIEVGNLRLLLLPILPPTPVHLLLQPWLIVPCEAGVELCDPDDLRTTLIPWNEVLPLVDGSRLTIAGHHQVRLIDEAAAQAWKERLLAWVKMNEVAREKDFLKFARQSLNPKTLAKQANQLSSSTRWMSWLALLIFLWAFGVVTMIYRWKGEGPLVMRALAELVLLLWIQAAAFFIVAGRAEQKVKHRFWKTLAIAFLPQHAMRAADLICRSQVCRAHPLASRPLLGEPEWKQLASQYWKNLRYGRAQSAELQMKALETFYREQGVTVAELEKPPVRQTGSAAYCPHCLTQFVDADALCQDCGGLVLKTWPEA